MPNKNSIYIGIIIFIVIVFLQFFSFVLIPEDSVLKYPLILGTSLFIFIFLLFNLTQLRSQTKNPLDKCILLFFLSMILSFFMAYIYWGQSFYSSLSLCRDFYIYLLYFLLVFFTVQFQQIERIIVWLFFASLLIFLIDYITFPNPLFAWRHEERRNGISIFFYGQGFTFLGAFYFLNEYFQNKKVKDLVWFTLSFACLFILTQSRMNLLALILGFFLLLYYSELKKKFLIGMIALTLGSGLFITSSIFNGIKEESEAQAESYTEDVRISAQNFFLNELQGGVFTVIFGNGIPGKNSDLEKAAIKGSSNGFFVSDVGLTGIYSYFGLFGAVIWILIFYYVFTIREIQHFNYLKAFFLTLLTTSLSGYSIFEPGYMPATVLALYLARYQSSIIYIIEPING